MSDLDLNKAEENDIPINDVQINVSTIQNGNKELRFFYGLSQQT